MENSSWADAESVLTTTHQTHCVAIARKSVLQIMKPNEMLPKVAPTLHADPQLCKCALAGPKAESSALSAHCDPIACCNTFTSSSLHSNTIALIHKPYTAVHTQKALGFACIHGMPRNYLTPAYCDPGDWQPGMQRRSTSWLLWS